MIRLALTGIWICAVTLGSGYIGATWNRVDAGLREQGEAHVGKATHAKVKPLSVPVFEGTRIVGYIVCQLSFIALPNILKKVPVKPDAFILDAAYKGIYTASSLDIAKIGKDSWPAFSKSVKDAVNSRYGADVLLDVLVEEYGYVPADGVRRGPISPKLTANRLSP